MRGLKIPVKNPSKFGMCLNVSVIVEDFDNQLKFSTLWTMKGRDKSKLLSLEEIEVEGKRESVCG